MPAKKTTVPAVKQQANIVPIADLLAADVAALKGQIAPVTGQMIRVTQDKRFKFPDGSEGAGPFAAVIVDFVTLRRYYQNDYDPDNISPPECFAIAREPKGMNPSPNSPVMQNPPEKGGCETCPQNQWGSDPKRDGKACKEHRRLAVLPAPDGKNPLTKDTPIWLLDISPTGLKPFDGFIAGVAKTFNAPPVAVTIDIGFDPQRSYPSVRCGDPQLNPEVVEYRGRKEEAMELLMAEPDVSGYGNEPPKPAARGRMGATKSVDVNLIRQWHMAQALDSYQSLARVINDLTEDEVLAALELEDASQRRRSIMDRLLQRAVRLRTLAVTKELKGKYHAS